MGAAQKLKELFFGAPKEAPKSKKTMQAAVEKVTEINSRSNPRRDKQEVEILKHKISKRFKEDPEAAKKAALIIEKMLNTPSKK